MDGTARAALQGGGELTLLLTGSQWQLAFVVGTVMAFVALPFYGSVCPWVAVAVFAVGVIIVHLRYAARFIVPFPHIFLLVAALQYVLAATASAHWPSYGFFDIGPRLPQYLPFATLVLLSCAAGWGLGLRKLRIPARRPGFVATPDLLYSLDALLVLGFLAVIPANLAQEGKFGFLLYLLSYLRYLGCYGRMVCHGPGAAWRMALVAVADLLFSTDRGSFHGFVLLGFWTFALLAFHFRISWRGIIVACMAGLLLLPTLQSSKVELRNYIEEGRIGDTLDTRSAWEKVSRWSFSMMESLEKTLGGSLDSEFLGNTVARYNQGWIVDKVMQHVPAVEPCALGETLKDTFISALIPRVFYPDKVVTGGRLNMKRFAGIELTEETSMNLGYAGEMYANFGYWGGIIGCGLYCFGFSLLFKVICKRAFNAPLWWAVLPYIFYVALKAEDDIVGVVNWISKACVVMAVVCFAFPAVRQALFPGKVKGENTRRQSDPTQREARRRMRGGEIMTTPEQPDPLADREVSGDPLLPGAERSTKSAEQSA